jgi:hypothetical protein
VLVSVLAAVNPITFESDEPFDASLARLGTRLKRFTQPKTASDQKRKVPQDRELAESIEKLASALQQQRKKREELFRMVSEVKLKIEEDNSLLSRQIEEELGLKDSSPRPGSAQGMRPEEKGKKLNALKKKLEEVFQREVPVSLSKRIQSLRRSLELEELLYEVSEEMDSGFASLGREDGEDTAKNGGQGTATGEEKDHSFSGQSVASEGARKTPKQRDFEDRSAPGGTGSGEEKGSGAETDMMEGFQAGQGSSSAKADTPREIDRKRGPILRERYDIQAEDPLIIHVKSLPVLQRAESRPEDVIRDYRREYEAVLEKEDIPLADRETIKNYFMSIGLREERYGRENN